MSKLSQEEWSKIASTEAPIVPKELVEKPHEDVQNKEIFQEKISKYVKPEKEYQDGVNQEINEIKGHFEVTGKDQVNIEEKSKSAEEQESLQNQVKDLNDQKAAAVQKAENKSAKLQELQQSNNQLDKQIEDDKATIKNKQNEHLAQETQSQDTQNEADSALSGASNEAE